MNIFSNIKTILSALSICLIFHSCSNDDFSIKGTIKDMPEQKFFLEQLGAKDVTSLDSGKTNADGSFSINGKSTESNLYRLRFAMGKYIMLVLKNDKLTINGDWNDLEAYILEGSQGSETLKSFLTVLREHIRDVNSLDYVTKQISKKGGNVDSMLAAVQEDLSRMNKDYVDYVKNFADTTSLVPNATFAANIINPNIEAYYLKTFYEKLPKRFPNSDLAKQFSEIYTLKYADALPKPQDKFTDKGNGKFKVTPADAVQATVFTANTPDGKTVSLSDFKGKYVLIDFWASWCAPCRAENPNVLANYRQFRDKNFEIIGVSLDDDANAWQKAIVDDGLAWPQVSELKKWQSVIARNYNVNSIPGNFLVNPEGYIIAENLHGEALEKKLMEVLE